MMSSSLRMLDGLDASGEFGADVLDCCAPAAVEDPHDLALRRVRSMWASLVMLGLFEG